MSDLTDLGLSKYEAEAYRALVDAGPATARELSETSDVPMGRIYDVLGSIESRQLARSQDASRPKKYVAVDPDAALDRLLAARERELDAEADQYATVADELRGELARPPEPDEGYWTAEVGADVAIERLVECIDDADESIHSVSHTVPAGVDVDAASNRIADHLVDALERDVTVRFLASPALLEDVPDAAGDPSLSLLEEYENFEARVGDSVHGDVTIVDGVEVCLDLRNPIAPEEAFAVIDLTDPSFATSVREAFDRGWEAADPIEG
ncbi:sugar-specific transcriptional regulator TrmB [Halarchaeum rubridurum]|uniref:Transcriptional regulator n=1 Tax=Halarchaeum rubridurum TaxID=489911 RepID=A0A830FSZ6_9EURY|nr:TrmB family transcriptional regulator [Halarchaeum rubridurum]MBP1954007.1 sugar-specific transcriptional regulator TrmB [Halarchaeum rubridurum]GGM56581.1 transcriptional regulator [Halarchaeum rubridurum]